MLQLLALPVWRDTLTGGRHQSDRHLPVPSDETEMQACAFRVQTHQPFRRADFRADRNPAAIFKFCRSITTFLSPQSPLSYALAML